MTAQESAGGEFTVTRATIDNGGGASEGGLLTVTGSIAQAEARPIEASGGPFTLTGGFWIVAETTPLGELLFSDGFESP